MVGGMSAKKCRESTYAGYFAEFGFGVDGVTAGVDIGLNNVAGTGPGTGSGGKGGTFTQRGAPSGVNKAGVGIGTPGPKVALCYYIPFLGTYGVPVSRLSHPRDCSCNYRAWLDS
jgi:hypothetical protein